MAGSNKRFWPVRRNALVIVWLVTFFAEPERSLKMIGCESSAVPYCDVSVLLVGRTIVALILEHVLSHKRVSSFFDRSNLPEEAIIGGLTSLMALHASEKLMNNLLRVGVEALAVFSLYLGVNAIGCFGMLVYEKVLDSPPDDRQHGPEGGPGAVRPHPATPRMQTPRNRTASPADFPEPAARTSGSQRQLRFSTTLPSRPVFTGNSQQDSALEPDDDSNSEPTRSRSPSPLSDTSTRSPPAEPQPKIIMYLPSARKVNKRRVSTRGGVRKKSTTRQRR